ncbi:ATP-binding protein [Phytohabitans rumicis]|uniref:AAA+ ATPase domain-containing protein n=1 Tax=Phytohabitans rumicis TaxID=1076125 RepID=A0A6V8LLQ7_9ACTN|nr:tetratricopeptide repeat protein [Phytohabitans rumicis]GFJ95559.1 hypothetical protein Prum_092010 [Phytohabitans rumicis]
MTETPEGTGEPVPPSPSTVSGSGLVAGGDVRLVGTYVAGRDLIIHQHPQQPVAAPSGIHMLPAHVIDFAGRDDDIRQALSWFEAGSGSRQAVPVLAIAGKAGVGKTTLAVHLGHELADRYPDGQLYVNLRGVEAERLDPAEVLSGFLRAFGVAGAAIPQELEERASLYRQFLYDRRMLVLLDNAASEAQVRPLLPGSPGCAVIVTSRPLLTALPGARLLTLDVMPPAQSIDLLAKILGESRVAGGESAAAEIAELCGHLPLALRIAAARLAARPRWPLTHLATRLRDEGTRIAELRAGDLEVRAAFALSYEGLAEADRQAFRRLGLIRASDFAAWVAAAVLDTDVPTAEEALERLVDAQLLESDGFDATGQPRYRFHDLLRSFARERMRAEEEPAELGAASGRFLGAYLALSKRGLYLLAPNSKRDPLASRATQWPPPGLDIDELMRPTPFSWFLVETQGIVAAVTQAYEAGLWDMTWELADPLHFHCRVFALWKPWTTTHELAVEAARRADNPRGEAFILRNLGNAYRDAGLPAKAVACYEASLDLGRRLDSRLIQAAALNGAGEVTLDRGRLVTARSYLEQAQAAWTDAEDWTGVAYGHTHLAVVYADQRLLDQAEEHAAESLRMQTQFRDRSGEAYARMTLGRIARLRDRPADAVAAYERCLEIYAEIGERLGAADARVSMAQAHRDQGRHEEAARRLDEAITTYLDFGGGRRRAIAFTVLAALDRDEGRLQAAAERLAEAIAVLRGADDILNEARAQLELARVRHAAGDAGAQEAVAAAISGFEQAGSPEVDEARALAERV